MILLAVFMRLLGLGLLRRTIRIREVLKDLPIVHIMRVYYVVSSSDTYGALHIPRLRSVLI